MGWGDIKDKLNEETYKGFRIVPGRTYFGGDGTPQQWGVSAALQRIGSDAPARVVTAKGRFAPDEQEAIRLSLEYGRSVIDGLVPGESTAGL